LYLPYSFSTSRYNNCQYDQKCAEELIFCPDVCCGDVFVDGSAASAKKYPPISFQLSVESFHGAVRYFAAGWARDNCRRFPNRPDPTA
jgi:hypothetical protein